METRDLLVAISSMIVGIVAGLGSAYLSQVMSRNTESARAKEALYATVLTAIKMFPERLRMTRSIMPMLASVGFVERRAEAVMTAMEQLGLVINQLVLSDCSLEVQMIAGRLSAQIEAVQTKGGTRRAQLQWIDQLAEVVDTEFQPLRDAMRRDLGRDTWLGDRLEVGS